MKVYTAVGVLDSDELNVADVVTYTDNTREIGTEWRLKTTGELVRRDAWVSVLRMPEETGNAQGHLG